MSNFFQKDLVEKSSSDEIEESSICASQPIPGQTIDDLPYKSEKLTLEMSSKILKQLEYVPQNIIEVAAFSHDNENPLVLKCYPLTIHDRKGRFSVKLIANPIPFPTIFWMSCPELSARIGHLEAAGQ